MSHREKPHGRLEVRWFLTLLGVLGLMAGCGRVTKPLADPAQLEFWNGIRRLCGQSFPGELVTATGADTLLAGQPLVLSVWQCYHRELRLAFHVGDDHSRVWLLSSAGEDRHLRLTHMLHDSMGSVLPFSGYGGDAARPGENDRQVFRADVNTVTRVPSARGSTWLLELEPGRRFTYALENGGRVRFRVDFDLREPLDRRQPSPWGYTRVRARGPESSPQRGP